MFPLDSEYPILTYDITYFYDLGNVNQDSSVDSADASFILSYYTMVSTGTEAPISDETAKRADVDGNGSIDSVDASVVLRYYAEKATGGNPNWEEILF